MFESKILNHIKVSVCEQICNHTEKKMDNNALTFVSTHSRYFQIYNAKNALMFNSLSVLTYFKPMKTKLDVLVVDILE